MRVYVQDDRLAYQFDYSRVIGCIIAEDGTVKSHPPKNFFMQSSMAERLGASMGSVIWLVILSQCGWHHYCARSHALVKEQLFGPASE